MQLLGHVALILMVMQLNRPVLAQEKVVQSDPMIDQLNQAQTAIQSERYTSAIQTLNGLIGQLKDRQNAKLNQFFPERYSGFSVTDSDALDSISGSNSFGVLLTKHYKNDADKTIDVILVVSDPSIEEYHNIIQNPQLLEHFEKTQIVSVTGNFKAIQKFSQEDRYCEYNIVINQDALLNVMANGVLSKDEVDAFTKQISFTGLKTFLEK